MTSGRHPQAGVSLIEVLVVLAIVGVMTGVTVLGLGALDRGAGADSEALRLADRLQLASDEVIVASVPLALVWDARGYRFLRWNAQDDAWRASEQRLLGERHDLPSALRLQRADGPGEVPVLITADLPQPAVDLRITGGSAPWAVSFDGFRAAAAPLER